VSATMLESIYAYLPQVAGAAVTLVLGYLVVRVLTAGIRRGMERAKVDPTLTSFAAHLVYMAGMVLLVISVLGQLGVNTTSFAAVLAAAGLAVGLALQGSLGNFASGVLLIFFRPFRVGDFVEAGGVSGTVEEVQVFASTLKTPDNKRITVPNSAITGGSIVNYSANPTRRIDLVFGIGYGDDIEKARQILERVLSDDTRILRDPAPLIAVLELADSSVNLAVRPWVNSGDYFTVRCDLLEKVKLEFDRQGISIPFPQRDVHMHQVA